MNPVKRVITLFEFEDGTWDVADNIVGLPPAARRMQSRNGLTEVDADMVAGYVKMAVHPEEFVT